MPGIPVSGNTRLYADGGYEGRAERIDKVRLSAQGMTVELSQVEQVLGSDGNDHVNLGGSFHGGTGRVDLGRGHDTLHLAQAQAYHLKLEATELVTGVAGATLHLMRKAEFATDGSFDITAAQPGRDQHTIVFTDITADITLSLSSSSKSTITFDTAVSLSVNGDGQLVVLKGDNAVTFIGPSASNHTLTIIVDGVAYSYAELLESDLIDVVPPSVVSVEASLALIVDADVGPSTFTVTVTFDEAMLADGSADPVLSFDPEVATTLSMAGQSWNDAGTVFTATYAVADAGVAVGAVSIGVGGARDRAMNLQQDYTAEVEFEIDTLNPTVTSFTEDNADGIVSPEDNVVAFSVTFSEAVASLTADDLAITGGSLSAGPVLADDGLSATFSVTATDNSSANLVVNLKSSVLDLNGNALTLPAAVTLAVDTAHPTLTSILRQAPTSVFTNSDTLVFRVTFSEGVAQVDATDFAISGTTAAVTGVAAVSSSVYDITVSGGDLAGLDANVVLEFAEGQDIVDLAGNALESTVPTSSNQSTYAVDNTAPTVALTAIGVSSWGYRFFGTGVETLNGEGSDLYPVAKNQIDWSKLWIEVDGSGTADITFTAADIAWLDPTQGSFWFGLTAGKIAEINAAVDGTNDLIVVSEGFWSDLAGNVQLVGGAFSATAVDLA